MCFRPPQPGNGNEQVLSSDLCHRACVYSYFLMIVPAVSVSLPGPHLSSGLPSDRPDSRQGKNSSAAALSDGHKQMCAEEVLQLTASPVPSPLPQASVRPNYQMLRLHVWHFLCAATSIHVLANICFISGTKTQKKNTQTSLVSCFTASFW